MSPTMAAAMIYLPKVHDFITDARRALLGLPPPSGAAQSSISVRSSYPPSSPREVEIALIALASVKGDVISIRARRSGTRIVYRIVDEYKTVPLLSETLFAAAVARRTDRRDRLCEGAPRW